ncbi:MAG TPA: ECF-type sigma factor [Phycisphaerae bacterium]|nr:sigma-70 family RNA polymerase sigma factor [Phycisphaerales bacterium]HRX83895.1 ECF-type sigma factor [Phycisphaerae bacterium]
MPERADNKGQTGRGPDVTMLLERVAAGDSAVADELLPIVYADLRAVAGGQFRGQRSDHTLQPTALVHEAYLRLVRAPGEGFKNRAHFMAVAATAMRQILRDHARAKSAAKRDSGGARVDLDQVVTPSGQQVLDAVELNDALTRLEEADPRMARIVDLWFFGGLTTEEIAELQGTSSRTVKRLWRQARAWLNSELSHA